MINPHNLSKRTLGKRLILILPPALLFVCLFFPILFCGEMFCFRDTGDYYFNLFQQIQEDLNAGHLPLWDMYENFGQPLLANPTTSFYYPLKLIFFLTALFPDCYPFCFKFYILIHYPIAFWGMARLARHWNLSRSGAALAALAYTFAGPVFFQYCNLIYLVGAAWLPWGIEQGDKLLKTGKIKHLLALSAVLYLTISGGDVELAYLAGFLCFTLWCYYRWIDRKSNVPVPAVVPEKNKKKKNKKEQNSSSVSIAKRLTVYGEKFVHSRLFLLMIAGIFAAFLSMAILLPAQVMGSLTDRSSYSVPASIWQIPSVIKKHKNQQLGNNLQKNYFFMQTYDRTTRELIFDGIFAKEQIVGGQNSAIYIHSLMPLRTFGFLWPKFDGNTFCSSQWWTRELARRTFWSPVFYMGILPILLALTALRFRRRNDTSPRTTIQVWLSWMTVIFLLGAWGTYGPAWFCRTFFSCLTGEFSPEYGAYEPVGGVYWFFTVFLPGFASFRYPEKLMTLVILGFALLAGLEWDHILESKKLRRLSFAVIILSLIMCSLTAFIGMEKFLPETLRPVTVSLEFPKIDQILILTFLQPVLMLALYGILFWIIKQRKISVQHPALIFTVLLLLAVDLFLALQKTIPTIPNDVLMSKTPLANRIHADAPNRPQNSYEAAEIVPPPRLLTFYYDFLPGELANQQEKKVTSWRKAALCPKHSTPEHITLFPTRMTMEPIDINIVYFLFYDELTHTKGNNFFSDLLERYDINYVGLPDDAHGEYFNLTLLDPDWLNHQEIVEKLKGKEPGPSNTAIPDERPVAYQYWKSTIPSSRVRIKRSSNQQIAVLQGSNQTGTQAASDAKPGESVHLTRYEGSRIEFDVNLIESGSVLVADQYWPGWEAVCTPADNPKAEPLRPEIVYDVGLRRIDLPAGNWHVKMVYNPAEVWSGISISLFAWLLFFALTLYAIRKERQEKLLTPLD